MSINKKERAVVEAAFDYVLLIEGYDEMSEEERRLRRAVRELRAHQDLRGDDG